MDERGEKRLLVIEDCVREPTQSWREVFRGHQGMWAEGASDGALGFRATLEEIYPTTRTQRCWVHMTATVLNAVPKTVQPQAKQAQHEIWQAATSEDAGAAFHHFIATHEAKYPNATMDLAKDCDSQPTFYDFPATNWQQLRATNPIEPAFATIRHRTIRAKRRAMRNSPLHLTFKLGE